MSRARRPDLAVVPDLDNELDELYGRALGEFTAARNELAKRLKKAGQNEEAENVAALTKPSTSAWAINRLARAEAERMRELLVAGEEVVAAQKGALAGEGADRFDDASRSQRDAVRGLVRAAEKILVEAGHRPSDAVKERISSSLRAASMDPEGRVLLERGRLAEDFESLGLGLLAGMAPSGSKRSAEPRSDRGRRQARVREARAALEAARKEERRLSLEVADAERDAKEAKEAAERAAERAGTLASEAESARAVLAAAERALEALVDE